MMWMGWHDGMAMLMSVDMSNVHMFLVWMDLHNGKGCAHDIDGCTVGNMCCHFFLSLWSSCWRPSIQYLMMWMRHTDVCQFG